MEIKKNLNGTELIVALEGALDTTTAPELQESLADDLNNVQSITFDLAELRYISSSGLRVLLSTHKSMSNKGGMKIKNLNDIVQEVFDVTGFSDILVIE
ncbi:MAG: STAS domain-containing protein [Eubacterium sp.]|nr:STAS domain-containing protein [Eubacterium sp.]